MKDGVVTSPSLPKTLGPMFFPFIAFNVDVNIADLDQFAHKTSLLCKSAVDRPSNKQNNKTCFLTKLCSPCYLPRAEADRVDISLVLEKRWDRVED